MLRIPFRSRRHPFQCTTSTADSIIFHVFSLCIYQKLEVTVSVHALVQHVLATSSNQELLHLTSTASGTLSKPGERLHSRRGGGHCMVPGLAVGKPQFTEVDDYSLMVLNNMLNIPIYGFGFHQLPIDVLFQEKPTYPQSLTGWWFGTWLLWLSIVEHGHGLYDFSYIGNVIIPTDELIFFRGVGISPPRLNIPPQS